MAGRARSLAVQAAAPQDPAESRAHRELMRVPERLSAPGLTSTQALQQVAESALVICQADGVLLELLEGETLVAQATAGTAVRNVGDKLPLHDSLLWHRLRQGNPVLCNDIPAQGWDMGPTYQRQGVRAVLAVPMLLGKAVIGTLKATSGRTGVFDERQQAHLQILAQALSALLHLRQVSAQLRNSEQQYRLLFDTHPQPMWVYQQDASLRFLAVNQAMQAAYGYSEQELMALGMDCLWLPQDRALWREKVLAVPPHQTLHGIARRHQRRDGTVCDVEISASGVVFNGQAARLVMGTDVTERLRAEREIARLARAQRLLGQCNEALVRANSEPALLQAVCDLVVRVGGYHLAWVGFAENDAQQSIRIAAHAGQDGAFLATLELSWSENDVRGMGPAGKTVRSGCSTLVANIRQMAEQAPWAEPLALQNFQGLIALPLRTEDQCLGLLQLYATEVLSIGLEEERLLQQMADNLAYGIQGLRTRKEQQHLQAAVFKMATAFSAATGQAFFEQLARHMSAALGAGVGCVVRLVPGDPTQAHALAAISEGQLIHQNETFSLAGTPTQELLLHKQFLLSDGLAQLYPEAPIVRKIPLKAYAGQQLTDSTGQVIGMVFVMFHQPLVQVDFVRSMLQVFAARAAAEIERQTKDQHLRHQASLLDKAQDAIIERDLQDRIIFWNQGAQRLYGWSADQALGQSASALLYQNSSSFDRANTAVQAQGEWSGEIDSHHHNGDPIETEGRWTLVRNDRGEPASILEINTDIGQRKAKDREIQRLAFFDTLTGLPNRMLLQDRMHHALTNAQRYKMGGALLYIDLDNFKTLNDTLGHDKGDLLLQAVAQRLCACVRSVDTVARLGGDEFVVLLEGLAIDPQALALEARSVGEKLLLELSQPYALAGYHYRSTPSIGIAPFMGDQSSVLDLLKQADLAMYQAKAAGRHALRFFDPQMQAVVTERAALENDLRQALALEQLSLHYQPQVDKNGAIVGVEALVRWNHPTRGMVPPAQFIAVAEETGLIFALGRWVLHTACKVLAQWRHDPLCAHLTMAVNVSPQQFHHENFVDAVARTLSVTEAPPEKLKLELTESIVVQDVDLAITTMQALHSLGVRFSLDDFGTGYSSLNYLKRMPLDQIKIDQSFVRDLFSDQNDEAIVRTIITLGQSLGLDVIAEGVETTEQQLLLARAGCLAFQGYLFSKPVPESFLERLLQAPLQG